MYSRKPYRSKDYRAWLRTQHGKCCIPGCDGKFEEPHHFGEKGIGQKCTDFLQCRLCRGCHSTYQGKRYIGFERAGEMDVLCAMQRDALLLLAKYAEYLEQIKPRGGEEELLFWAP